MEEYIDKSKKLVIYGDLEIKKAMSANDLYAFIWDLKEWLRSEMKYHNKPYDEVWEKVFELLEDNGINMDNYE